MHYFLFAKLLCLVFWSGFACIQPFFPLYLKINAGLDEDMIGIINSFFPISIVLFAPLWTFVADNFQMHRLILQIVISFHAGILVFIVLDNSVEFLIIIRLISAIFGAGIIPLLDSTVLLLVQSDKKLYGKQRLFGAVGWGLTALIMGFVLDFTGDLSIIFYIFLFALGGLVFLLFILPLKTKNWQIDTEDGNNSPTHIPVEESVEEPAKDIYISSSSFNLNAFKVMMKNTKFLLFLITAIIMGSAQNMLYAFFFIFLHSLHASDIILGLVLFTNTVSEIPVFFFSKQLISKFGIRGMIVAAHITLIFRILAYTWVNEAWQVIPIELLHGITFSAMWSAGISYSDSCATKRLEATAQGVFSASYNGIGGCIGSLIGGIIFYTYGSLVLFYSTSILLACFLIFFLLTQWHFSSLQNET